MIELTSDTLAEVVNENSKVIVQYGATWCGVCRVLKPRFKALASESSDITFLYVDAEKFPNSRNLANIENLPTFAGFVNGKLVKQATGGKEETIKEVLNEVASN